MAEEIKTLDDMVEYKVSAIMEQEKAKVQSELKASFDNIFQVLSTMQKHGLNDLLDEQEVADYLKLSPSIIKQWRKDKKDIPYVKLSPKIVRYKFKDILDYINTKYVFIIQNGRVI